MVVRTISLACNLASGSGFGCRSGASVRLAGTGIRTPEQERTLLHAATLLQPA
jgi:hypothetical protein